MNLCSLSTRVCSLRELWLTVLPTMMMNGLVQEVNFRLGYNGSKTPSDQNTSLPTITGLHIKIEPQRLHPARHFVYHLANEETVNELVYVGTESGVSYVGVRIPFEKIGIALKALHPVRIDVRVQKENEEENSWRPNNPITSRLMLGSDNPADLGWLIFDH
jgi:hypothetical protein